MTILMLREQEKMSIAALRELASGNPVDINWLKIWIGDPDIKAAHLAQMTAQTIQIPADFMVTFSVETGHPAGVCRHMSMSVGKAGRVPSPQGVWMVAEEFGFVGSLEECTVWKEDLNGHGIAINVVQPLAVVSP